MNEKVVITSLWLSVFVQVAAISSYSPFVPLMKQDLGFNFAGFGIIAAIFFLSYTLMQTLVGRASDNGHARRLIMIGLPTLVSLAILFSGIQNLLEAVTIRILAGVAAAMIFVPALRVMSRLVSRRGLNTSIALIGTSIAAGGLYISLVGPKLGLLFGWRLAIVILMAPTFIVCLLNARFVPETGRVSSESKGFPSWVLRKKETWILGYQQFARIGVWYTVTIWLPTFFTTMLGYNLVLGGAALTLFSVSGMFSSIAGGRLANRFSSASKVIMLSFVALTITMAVIAFYSGSLIGWVLVAAFGIFDFMPFGPIFAIIPKLYDEDTIGFVTGFENMLANFGAVVVPFLFGFLIDLSGSFSVSWLLIAFMCLGSSILGIPAIRFEKKGLIAH